jgi:transcriptional regulator with XRE-family HTH domain
MDTTGKSPDEIVADLGERLRALRLGADLTQAAVADKAGVSERSLRDLESGQGSTVETLVRVLKALGVQDLIGAIAPRPAISPMQLLQKKTPRRRASGTRGER